MKTNRRWMAFGVLFSLFLSGVAVGGVGVLLLRSPSPPTRSFQASPPVNGFRDAGPPTGPPAFVSERIVQRLAQELELDADQQDSVRAILQRQRELVREELATVAPRLRASVDSASAQIRRMLDPEQRIRFDEIGGIARPGFDRVRPGPPGQVTY